MTGKSRLELRVSDELKAAVRAAADDAGQDMSVFGERALEAALRKRGTDAADGGAPSTSARAVASPPAPRPMTPRPKGQR